MSNCFQSQELCTPSRAQFIWCRLEPKYCHLLWLAECCVKTHKADFLVANFVPVAKYSHSDLQWQILSDIFRKESQMKKSRVTDSDIRCDIFFRSDLYVKSEVGFFSFFPSFFIFFLTPGFHSKFALSK